MFPEYLDGAKVIEYTRRGSYGVTVDPWDDGNPPKEKEIAYIAICQYDGCSGYNLFWCDEEYCVLQDWLLDSIDECKRFLPEAASAVWIRKEEQSRVRPD